MFGSFPPIIIHESETVQSSFVRFIPFHSDLSILDNAVPFFSITN